MKPAAFLSCVLGCLLLVGCGGGVSSAQQRSRHGARNQGSVTAPSRSLKWHRVGHRPVQPPGISDGPARPHSYFSVVAFDSGEVVPLNDWYHPQLFQYVPASSALVSRAYMFPHAHMGNEDDIRWRIRAHKGATAAQSLVFWHVMSWEEITDENGAFAHDAAVFSSRPVQASAGIMPTAIPRVINMGADATDVGPGPYRGGIDYDEPHHLLFVSTDRSDRSEGHTIFQAFNVDTVTGRFMGRARANAPGPNFCQAVTFIRADPAHGLVLTLIENRWERQRSILYLVHYTPRDGDAVATFDRLLSREGPALDGHDGDTTAMPIEARDAVFAEHGGHVWAVLAGHALFTFDLGPVGGPYVLEAPVGKIPLTYLAEGARRVADELIVSSHGLETYALGDVLAVRGEGTPAVATYRLPYPTYELDVANMHGRPTMFLASGTEGIEIFEHADASGGGSATSLSRSAARPIRLRTAPAEILTESGHGLRTLGPPTSNADGDVAFWAVTQNGHEAIVLERTDGSVSIVAESERDGVRALGHPSLASNGRVAFWAGRADGSQSIVLWDGARHELGRTDAQTVGLAEPEISEAGAVVFARQDAAGVQTLVRRGVDGSTATVFTDGHDWAVPADEGAVPAEYDISPSGDVVFVRSHREDGRLELAYWNGTRAFDVQSEDREVNFPRIVVDGLVTYRSWSGEIIKLRLLRASHDGPGGLEAIADRHSDYHGFQFGNFGSAAALAGDDVVFSAVKYAHLTLEPEELASSLHRFTGSSPTLPGTIVATADRVDDATVRNVLFADGASAAHGVVMTLELERPGAAVSYALVRTPPRPHD